MAWFYNLKQISFTISFKMTIQKYLVIVIQHVQGARLQSLLFQVCKAMFLRISIRQQTSRWNQRLNSWEWSDTTWWLTMELRQSREDSLTLTTPSAGFQQLLDMADTRWEEIKYFKIITFTTDIMFLLILIKSVDVMNDDESNILFSS